MKSANPKCPFFNSANHKLLASSLSESHCYCEISYRELLEGIKRTGLPNLSMSNALDANLTLPFQRLNLLTKREADVLKLLVRGQSIKTIANNLHISRHTAADYTKGIYIKLGVHSKAELVAKLNECLGLDLGLFIYGNGGGG